MVYASTIRLSLDNPLVQARQAAAAQVRPKEFVGDKFQATTTSLDDCNQTQRKQALEDEFIADEEGEITSSYLAPIKARIQILNDLEQLLSIKNEDGSTRERSSEQLYSHLCYMAVGLRKASATDDKSSKITLLTGEVIFETELQNSAHAAVLIRLIGKTTTLSNNPTFQEIINKLNDPSIRASLKDLITKEIASMTKLKEAPVDYSSGAPGLNLSGRIADIGFSLPSTFAFTILPIFKWATGLGPWAEKNAITALFKGLQASRTATAVNGVLPSMGKALWGARAGCLRLMGGLALSPIGFLVVSCAMVGAATLEQKYSHDREFKNWADKNMEHYGHYAIAFGKDAWAGLKRPFC